MMKSFRVTAVWLAAILTAAAQTNTDTAAPRALALDDCIQQALAHNFDVQVQRYNPQIALNNLHGAYAGYDPLFSLSGQHNYNSTGPDGFPAATSYGNSFKTGLNGSSPWGMAYDFSGTIAEQYGGTLNAGTNQSSGGSVQVQLTQPLLKNFWIDNTRLAILVDKNRLKFSEQGLRGQFITTVSAVENAYYELDLRAAERHGADAGARPGADTAGSGPAARANRQPRRARGGAGTGRGAGGAEQGQLDCRAIHAGHGSKHAEKSDHRFLFHDARRGHRTDGHAGGDGADRSICRKAGARA